MIAQAEPIDMDGEAGLYALLYVSRVAVDADRLAWSLADIQTVSVARNTACNITGLLIATPHYFAQLIEGSRDGLDAVMARIRADSRHVDIKIINDGPAHRRIGPSWRLFRFDAGSFEERHVTPVLERAHRDSDKDGTGALMTLVRRLLSTRRETAAAGDRPRDGTA
jgi:hypothetical protein